MIQLFLSLNYSLAKEAMLIYTIHERVESIRQKNTNCDRFRNLANGHDRITYSLVLKLNIQICRQIMLCFMHSIF